MAEKIVWGIHAGSNGDSHYQFLKNEVIALGWNNMGDMSLINPERQTFRQKLMQAYPGRKKGTDSANLGELYRFTYEVNIGDIVVYPSKYQRKIHICRVAGGHQYDPSQRRANLYPVTWLIELPRSYFSPEAIKETGNRLSFFRIRKFADEFLTAIYKA